MDNKQKSEVYLDLIKSFYSSKKLTYVDAVIGTENSFYINIQAEDGKLLFSYSIEYPNENKLENIFALGRKEIIKLLFNQKIPLSQTDLQNMSNPT